MNENEIDILLVDDSEEDVDLAVRALRSANVNDRLFVAQDGEEALNFLFCTGPHSGRSFGNPPKLVLLDLKLPKMDGLQVLKQIKSDSRTRNICVVLLTSSREERDMEDAYNFGANSYLQKPVDFDEFRRTINYAAIYWLTLNRPMRWVEGRSAFTS